MAHATHATHGNHGNHAGLADLGLGGLAGLLESDLDAPSLCHGADVRVASRSIPPRRGSNSIPAGSPHVRPTEVHRTCGEPNEIKKGTHPENIIYIPALPRGQVRSTTNKRQKRKHGGGDPEATTLRDDARATALRGDPKAATTLRGDLKFVKAEPEPDVVYALRAVQFHPNGGQFDTARLPARPPHGAYV